MPVETLLIGGPAGGGKTTLARLLARYVVTRPVHYLRMRPARDGHTNTVVATEPSRVGLGEDGWGSAHAVTYAADRAFETLPDGLRAVRKLDRYAFAAIEADGDPALRHAYPYDYRVFVMPPLADVTAVFRDPRSAAQALHQVMQDTAAFASEIFGLFDAAGLDDSVGVYHSKPVAEERRCEPVEQLDVRESQIRQFLSSPLGAEIASRIQLQPEFHALVESDIVVINTGAGTMTDALDECVDRLERLLGRVRHDTRRHSVLYWGDITDVHDPAHNKLLERLRALLSVES